MANFHELTVTDIKKTIRNAVIVTLEPRDGSAGEFEFTQGQYLTFRRKFDGEEIRRSYSICSGKNQGDLQVGIKQVDGGAFSTWANEALKQGDTLEAMRPAGSFFQPVESTKPKSYLAFAGGSGITPILSILRTVLDTEPDTSCTLVYANQGANTIMFREELEDLKNIHMGRLAIVHILENDAQNADLFAGRIDRKKCTDLFKSWIDISSVDRAFICGPEPMMVTISQALKDHGLGKDQIRYEMFAGTQTGRAPRRADTHNDGAIAPQTQLSVTLDGTSHHLEIQVDVSVLEAALANDLDVPFACKAGVCSSCRCKVLDGEVEMVANHSLEDYEVEKGYVLACQSYALSKNVTVDFDQ